LVDAKGVFRGCVSVTRDVTELKRDQLELEKMSIVDELTGLYNRRGFRMLAEQQLKLVRRSGRAPVIVFVDINEMKWINDNLGHEEGDGALRDAAKVLKDSFRDSDIVARLGGDEFVIFAIDAGANAELLRARVHANVDELNANRTHGYRLSLSVGVVQYDPAEPQSIDALIAKADKLMYEGKLRRRAPSGIEIRAGIDLPPARPSEETLLGTLTERRVARPLFGLVGA
jgi:diguanylate cyclase (GGDEF)-like protein